MKIDIFCHIFPQKFYDRMLKIPERGSTIKKRVTEIPSIVDLDVRFRIMDEFREYIQVVCLPAPPIEALGDAQHSPELAELGNDGMAELVAKHPSRFAGFIAAMPMNNPRSRGKGDRAGHQEARRRGNPDLYQREWPAAGRTRFSAHLREDGRARRAHLGASGARRGLSRLPDGEEIQIRDVVGFRLALRDQHFHGANYFCRILRPLSETENHHPSFGRHGSLLFGTHGAGPRSVGRADRRGRSYGLLATPEKAPAGIFQDVLRRHRHVWLGRAPCAAAWTILASTRFSLRRIRPSIRKKARDTFAKPSAASTRWRFPKQTAAKSTRATRAGCFA